MWILKVLGIISTEGFCLAGFGEGYPRPVAMNIVFITALFGATVTIAFKIREWWNQIKVINREDRHV